VSNEIKYNTFNSRADEIDFDSLTDVYNWLKREGVTPYPLNLKAKEP
jgi:hypothetical protein